MFALIIILSTVIFLGCYYLFKEIQKLNKAYEINFKVPGPEGENFLFGNFQYIRKPRDELLQALFHTNNQYYPIYKTFAIYKVGVNILTPEDAEIVLSNSVHNEKSLIYNVMNTWLGYGLLTSKHSKWHSRRKILTPAFHFNILQKFIAVFNEESSSLVDVLKEECKKSYSNISQIMAQFTLKIIAETAMGTKLTFQSEKEKQYKNAVFEMGEILIYRIINPFFMLKWPNLLGSHYSREKKVARTLHQFTKEVIINREKNFTNDATDEHDVYKGKKRLAMLDLLIQAKREGLIDDEGIQEEVDTFMFEGHDTTAVALGFIFMLLACHREVQDLIYKELELVLGDVHKKPSYNDFQEMKYLERCIKESLRLYPSVFLIARTLGAKMRTHTGYLLANGTNAIIHIYSIHRNPEIYPHPEKFDPDRFLPENIQKRHPYAYLPFSAGPRNCIGQKFALLELKSTVSTVLANFILEPIDTPETINFLADIVLRTKDPIKVRFKPRF